MNTNGHEDRWTCLAATKSRDEGRERGRPARTTLAQPHPSLPPGSTGNGPTIPLQPSPGRSCRQGGRVPHHGETERTPKAEDAGGTPALPGGAPPPILLAPRGGTAPADAAVPSRFVCLRRPSRALVDHSFFFCFRQAPPPSCRVDHRRVKHPIVNRDEPRMNTKTDGPACLRRRHGRKPSGSAGVPPAQHWHSLTPLSHPARPATAPGLCLGRAHAVPGGRVAGRRITGKLSGHPTQRMRARRPRSRRGASSLPSCSTRRHSPCRCGRAVPLRVPSSSFACLGGSLFFLLFQASTAPVLPCGS